jgi:hypothetical protein
MLVVVIGLVLACAVPSVNVRLLGGGGSLHAQCRPRARTAAVTGPPRWLLAPCLRSALVVGLLHVPARRKRSTCSSPPVRVKTRYEMWPTTQTSMQ